MKNKRNREKAKKLRRKKKQAFLSQLVVTLLISLLFFTTVGYFTIRLPKMEGYAMTTTLTNNDRVVVNRWGTIKRFALVYFKQPITKEVSIRRVIGLPGEELYYKNDALYINNKRIPERFLEQAVLNAKQSGFLLTQDFTLKQVTDASYVPQDKYFVMGDNRQFSTDSRNYRFVDKKDIIGVVEMRLFPTQSATRF